MKQEMALESVSFFFFIPDLSLVTLVYFDLFIHEQVFFDIVVLWILKGQIVSRRLWYFQ